MPHGGRAWRKNRDIGAAFALKFELRGLQFFANLIVADLRRRRRFRGISERGGLLLAEFDERGRLGSVMSVAINDHWISGKFRHWRAEWRSLLGQSTKSYTKGSNLARNLRP